MSLQSRKEYLEKIRGRYERGGRIHKTKLLDEFCLNCGYHRKHAVRLLAQRPKPRRCPGPRPKYGEAALVLLKEFWLCSDQMCSKRLKQAAPDWLPFFKASLAARCEVAAMSPATMDRLLAPSRARLGRKRRSGTKPGSLLKKHIPIRTGNEDINRVGYLEADTVAHCGSSMAGDFAWTLTFTDIQSGWTQCRAIWNKAHHAIHQHLQRFCSSVKPLAKQNALRRKYLAQLIERFFEVLSFPADHEGFFMIGQRELVGSSAANCQ